jgi:hypothetical protein
MARRGQIELSRNGDLRIDRFSGQSRRTSDSICGDSMKATGSSKERLKAWRKQTELVVKPRHQRRTQPVVREADAQRAATRRPAQSVPHRELPPRRQLQRIGEGAGRQLKVVPDVRPES